MLLREIQKVLHPALLIGILLLLVFKGYTMILFERREKDCGRSSHTVIQSTRPFSHSTI